MFQKPWQRKLFLLWELPQYALGVFLVIFLKKRITVKLIFRDVSVFFARSFPGGISLSSIIILNSDELISKRCEAVLHEYGHSMQSLMLGWLYLPLVGLPSLIRSLVWKKRKLNSALYYGRYPESWAEKLAKTKKY